MIPGCISKYVCINGKIVESNNVTIPQASMVLYDVLRVYNTIPLFAELHANRFFESFTLAQLPQPFMRHVFETSIYSLISKEQIIEGNIRCAYYVSETPVYMVYQIAHSYPTPQMYQQGIDVALLHAMRENPNVKQELQVRSIANTMIAEQGVYDVLLVDADGNITEGSRTNAFFIKDDTVYTAPACDVLVGITRKKITELMNQHNIPCVEQKIPVSDIAQFDAACLTGTSPKILPIASILQTKTFSTQHSCLQLLQNIYNEEIETYVSRRL
ncbi:MAG TPA: aminotransferase class IV [Bacteroidales bacterium]|nr:MAG: Branched-chain-amino-acid aminotransferase [Bacteroidetes bacterium ADurb.Bin217]HOS84757.1 aminotransferase class IV [Bacteroidales bacterium]HPM13765.1 aminotransferase class IV [Bacteroidales bacterium]